MKDKTTEDEIYKKILRALYKNLGEGPYRIEFGTDDGGRHVQIKIGMTNPQARLENEYPNFPLEIWPGTDGWRVIIMKVPKEMLYA